MNIAQAIQSAESGDYTGIQQLTDQELEGMDRMLTKLLAVGDAYVRDLAVAKELRNAIREGAIAMGHEPTSRLAAGLAASIPLPTRVRVELVRKIRDAVRKEQSRCFEES